MRKKLSGVVAVIILANSWISFGANPVSVVGFDRQNHVLTRWDSTGRVLWQSTDITHDAYQMEIGPDGYIYLGMWVDDRTAKIDPITGNRVAEVAIQQVPATDRVWDITFGNDFDKDGIADLWVAAGHNGAGDGYILAYGSASGFAGSSERAWGHSGCGSSNSGPGFWPGRIWRRYP
jgi:hypothetical protein